MIAVNKKWFERFREWRGGDFRTNLRESMVGAAHRTGPDRKRKKLTQDSAGGVRGGRSSPC